MENLAINIENIDECIEKTRTKIFKLNDFISLSLRRNKMAKELEELALDVIKDRDLLAEVEQVVEELHTLKYDYEAAMSQMRRKQIVVMGYIIKEKQRKVEEKNKVNLLLNCAPKSSVHKLGHNLAKIYLNHELSVTPKIKISEYKESPLVKKKINPLPFQFEEFDVTINQQQFDSIPKYMCGRETLDQLNSFLETAIIPCFNEKYKLVHKERSCLRNMADIELWKLYNEQASYLPGHTFITPGDLSRKLNKMLDKKTQNRLTMLRHIGILNEVRVKQTVCYVWCFNGHK